jgi:hypothetical protein
MGRVRISVRTHDAPGRGGCSGWPDTISYPSAQIGEATGCRTLDALHLAAAMRVGGPGSITVLTFDVRQAQAARTLGLGVAGA